jgi:hypothetical protein
VAFSNAPVSRPSLRRHSGGDEFRLKVLLDPSFLLSRRGTDWVERVERNGETSSLVFPQRFLELQHDYEVVRQFRALFWGARAHSYEWRAPLRGVEGRKFDEFRQNITTSGFGLAAEVAADCLVNLRDNDVVLVARRRDMLDLVSQIGIPLIQRGRDSFEEEFIARLPGRLSEPLINSLQRRTRYLAWVDRSKSDLAVHVADIGRGQTY